MDKIDHPPLPHANPILPTQGQYDPMTGAEQVAVIYCGVKGYLDEMPPEKIVNFEDHFRKHVKATHVS